MLTISGLTYRIGGRTLLNEAGAQIPAGSKVGLVGRNGAGKSTLLALIRGAAQPDAGTIRLPRGDRKDAHLVQGRAIRSPRRRNRCPRARSASLA